MFQCECSHFRNRLPTYRQIQDFTELEKNQFKPDADGHLFLFTPQELGDVAAEVGLAVEQLYVWGTPLLTGHLGFRFLANSWSAQGVGLFSRSTSANLAIALDLSVSQILLPGAIEAIRQSVDLRKRLVRLLMDRFPRSCAFVEAQAA